jgi:hypothetical protein
VRDLGVVESEGEAMRFPVGHQHVKPETRRLYRCLYCWTRDRDPADLRFHEMVCDMRLCVQRYWALRIEKARQREQVEQNGEIV